MASLFVLNARGATLADGKLTLTGVSPNSIVFADRPVRAAGHIETAQFVEKWNEGEDQANIDPPNATVSVLSGADVADAVVTISAPVLEGDNLTFDAVVLEGTLDGATGPAALFIDRGGFGGFHGGGGMGPAASTAAAGGADHFSQLRPRPGPARRLLPLQRLERPGRQLRSAQHLLRRRRLLRRRSSLGRRRRRPRRRRRNRRRGGEQRQQLPLRLSPYCGYAPYPPCN